MWFHQCGPLVKSKMWFNYCQPWLKAKCDLITTSPSQELNKCCGSKYTQYEDMKVSNYVYNVTGTLRGILAELFHTDIYTQRHANA